MPTSVNHITVRAAQWSTLMEHTDYHVKAESGSQQKIMSSTTWSGERYQKPSFQSGLLRSVWWETPRRPDIPWQNDKCVTWDVTLGSLILWLRRIFRSHLARPVGRQRRQQKEKRQSTLSCYRHTCHTNRHRNPRTSQQSSTWVSKWHWKAYLPLVRWRPWELLPVPASNSQSEIKLGRRSRIFFSHTHWF